MPATIPLLDTARQSLVVRLDDVDCLLRVWWQPSDSSWWAGIEVPVGTPAVRSRRLANDVGLLDRIEGLLPGNLVCRSLGAPTAPGRNAWSIPTHVLRWEETEDISERPDTHVERLDNLVRPGTASGLSTTPSDETITLKWDRDPVAGAYVVQWKSGTDPYSIGRQTISYLNQVDIEDLTTGTVYTFRVRALNAHKAGDWSAGVTETPI